MDGLRVVPTWRHGQERLYVCGTDGRNIAWYDRETFWRIYNKTCYDQLKSRYDPVNLMSDLYAKCVQRR